VRNEGNWNARSTSARPVGAPGGGRAMSVPPASSKAMTPEKMERELLARLGLDSSATPEDVNTAHEAVTAYLAAAPRDLRSWARAQASGADEAYALLTDPAALARAVALVGAGARSDVLPGGPATPPAHRDSPAPAAAAVPPTAAAVPAIAAPRYDEDGRRIVSDDEIDALLAEVDPTAHREVVGTPAQRAAALTAVAPVSDPRGSTLSNLLASKAFRNLALVGATVAAIGIVAVFGFNAGDSSAQAIGANPAASAAPAASAPVLDQAAVGALMEKIQANPKDADALMALGDEYYKVGDFATAGNWFTKVTALEPTNVRGFLALGATGFNSGDLDAAEVAWRKALDIDDKNVEANYDLGFLYFNRQPPDMAKVQEHWNRVVELDPDSEIAQTVKAHLGAIASMVPGSPAPGASAAPSAAPAASPAATPAATPAPSAAPSATPQP
jgi:cytochrome c-type biogenesis protein CcmH/NrfG